MTTHNEAAQPESGDANATTPAAPRRSRRATRPAMAPENESAGTDPAPTTTDAAQSPPGQPAPDPATTGNSSSGAGGNGSKKAPAKKSQQSTNQKSPAPKAGAASGTAPEPAQSPASLDVLAEFGSGTAGTAGTDNTESADSTRSAANTPEPSSSKSSGSANRNKAATTPKRSQSSKTSKADTSSSDDQPRSSNEKLDDLVIPERSEPDSPRLPATALLFQAPDLTPRQKSGSKQRQHQGSSTGADSSTGAADQSQPADAQPEEPGSGRGKKPADQGAAGAATGEPSGEAKGSPGREGKDGRNADQRDGRGESSTAKSSQSKSQAKQSAATESSKEDGGEDESVESDSRQRRRRRRGGRGRRRSGQGDKSDEQSASQDGQGSGSNQGSTADPQTDHGAGGTTDHNTNDHAEPSTQDDAGSENGNGSADGSRRRRRRRARSDRSGDDGARAARDSVTALKGSTRLEAKRQRRRDGRDTNRRKAIITEAEFLARRESVDRDMIVREEAGRTQVAVLEDDVLVEHYVARKSHTSMVGNVYLGRVQNVLPSMEAAFVDLGRGRNAVLYAGEVNWDAAGLSGQPRKIEQALSSGDTVLVQVTKDPIGHKGARLTSQITLAGRFLVLVPGGSMTGISRKLPDTERNRLKKLLGDIVPEDHGVIVRTAAEGASEDELRRDVERLSHQWAEIDKKSTKPSTVPTLLKGEPELATRVVRDVFNDDFRSLTVSGKGAWKTISEYVNSIAPDLADRTHQWTKAADVFAAYRVDEQLSKGMDRKVWLPSGGSLVIDRTEAMTVVDVNTGKFTGSGGTLEETVTKNNLEAAEEIVRQLRLRDIGGIIVIDFIDMVLESNRDLVLRRLVECLGRDRTRHQVAEVTSLGLVQMTRKRVGQGLVEAFSQSCECCHGRGFIVTGEQAQQEAEKTPPKSGENKSNRRSRKSGSASGAAANAANAANAESATPSAEDPQREQVKATLATIAAAAASVHDQPDDGTPGAEPTSAERATGEAASAQTPQQQQPADEPPAGSGS